MPDYPDIWFLRHGETEWNLEGRIQGRRDSPLTARGRAQALRQGAIIAPIAARIMPGAGPILVSPLGRARETAALALPDLPARFEPRLAEIDTGAWEGRLKADLPAGLCDLEFYGAAPGGEGVEALMARVEALLQDLGRPTIIVSHGLLGQVLRGLVLGLDRALMGTLPNRQGCVMALSGGAEEILTAPEPVAGPTG
ncbi:histidine phosphatase family protein [Roseovarius spongiae]|uniref:Histidine phosphatase family protein n=1 Tax=Roseovarius spongiae TaxID=2320272 RepID=A0A3A8AVL4_9RHOB|nr:histidine phosphatase family protein [Roseovarius spongiae]RKF15178.1 histidine phosphatase family protein [Roseovarius spongiae]